MSRKNKKHYFPTNQNCQNLTFWTECHQNSWDRRRETRWPRPEPEEAIGNRTEPTRERRRKTNAPSGSTEDSGSGSARCRCPATESNMTKATPTSSTQTSSKRSDCFGFFEVLSLFLCPSFRSFRFVRNFCNFFVSA